MKKNKIPIFTPIILILFIGIFFVLYLLKQKESVRLKIGEIREEYKGIIIEKFSVRNTPPTHLKIKTTGNEFIEISPNQAIVKKASIGDSVIKPKNENFVYLITPNKVKVKFFYTRLSYETRNSKYFPKEWKNKWMESSEWDN